MQIALNLTENKIVDMIGNHIKSLRWDEHELAKTLTNLLIKCGDKQIVVYDDDTLLYSIVEG